MKSYVTFMDYVATGEGRTIEILYSFADDKEEAVKKHFLFFKYITKESQDYFRQDIMVYDIDDPKLEITLNGLFKENSKWIYKVLNEATQEFCFKWHFNYS